MSLGADGSRALSRDAEEISIMRAKILHKLKLPRTKCCRPVFWGEGGKRTRHISEMLNQ